MNPTDTHPDTKGVTHLKKMGLNEDLIRAYQSGTIAAETAEVMAAVAQANANPATVGGRDSVEQTLNAGIAAGRFLGR